MSENCLFQINFKGSEPVLANIYATDEDELGFALDALQAAAEHIRETRTALVGVTEAQAVATVQQSFPGSQVVNDDMFAFNNSGVRGTGGDNDLEARLRAKGFVPDKYHDGPGQGGWWYPKKFDQAPSCQCGGDKQNHGKLALKVGRKRDGDELTGWFCANTFNRGKSAGCAAVFSGQFPEV